MLNISIFDITYSSYGKYLESNVFMNKQRFKTKKHREEGDHQEIEIKQRQNSMYSSTHKNSNFGSNSMPSSTLNSKAQPFTGISSKNNNFLSSKQPTSLLNNTIGGTNVSFKDDKNGKNALNNSQLSLTLNNGERPRTSSIGTAVFRSVERNKTPGFCHFFHRENLSEIKYKPKYDLITEKAPAFSIGKAIHERVISENIHQKQEKQKDKIYTVCTKNPLLKDIQEVEGLIQDEIDRENDDKLYIKQDNEQKRSDGFEKKKIDFDLQKKSDQTGQKRNSCFEKKKSDVFEMRFKNTENDNSKESSFYYDSNSQQNKDNRIKPMSSEQQKRSNRLSNTNTQENISSKVNTPNNFSLNESRQPSFSLKLKTKISLQKQNTFTSNNDGSSPKNSKQVSTHHNHAHNNFNLSSFVKRGSASPSAKYDQDVVIQSQKTSQKKRKSMNEGKYPSEIPSLSNINSNLFRENSQNQGQQQANAYLNQPSNQNTRTNLNNINNVNILSKSQGIMQPKETKIGGIIDGEVLALAEMRNTKESFYDQSAKKRFHIQINKQTQRPSSVKRPISQDEYRFNNYSDMKVSLDKAHPFSSYTHRKVFEPKENAPSYDIHKVNYDRLLTNDKLTQGNVSFNSKPFEKIPVTKHEVNNQITYSNLKHNEVLSASVRLDYPLKEQAYFKQSGVRRPQTVNFGKSSPRKKLLFQPQTDGGFKDYVAGEVEQKNSGRQSHQDYSVTYYQPGDITNRNERNKNKNNVSYF